MEQLIFTYCFKRHFEVGRGWGFFSYSEGVKEYYDNDEAFRRSSGSLAYNIPQNMNVWLITNSPDMEECLRLEDEAIRKYHPVKFSYQLTDTCKGEKAVLRYGRNLGREIINVTRPMNKVVYTLIGDKAEITEYPCFYFGIEQFEELTREKFKSVTEQAPLLDRLTLKTGSTVSRDMVHDFISASPEREDMLVSLFYTLLEERSGKNRPIIICDRNENIIFWIAACTLLFPKNIAEKIFFSTYESLGKAGSSVELPEGIQLCGVYSPTANGSPDFKATNYDPKKLTSEDNAVLFDIEKGIIPEPETDDFEEVVRSFCRGDEKPLNDYFEAVSQKTIYADFGREYTKFYNAAEDDTDIYKFYNNEIKKEIFDNNYPLLFDSSASFEDKQKAMNITEISFESGILEKKQLLDDIFTYAADVMKSNSSKLDELDEIERIILLADHTVDKLIRRIIAQAPDKWLDLFVMQAGVPEDKVLRIMHLYDPFEESESEMLRMFAAKEWSESGRKLAQDYIFDRFRDSFGGSRSKHDIQKIQNIVELIGDSEKVVQDTAGYFLRWEHNCKSEAAKKLDQMPLGREIYENIETKVWSASSPFDTAFEIMEILKEQRSAFYKDWNVRFMTELGKAVPGVQKKVISDVIISPKFGYDISMNGIIKNIYDEYSFISPQELAEFSLLVWGSAVTASCNDTLSYELIERAICELAVAKKDWKKSVDSAVGPALPQNVIKNTREMLIQHGCEYISSNSNGSSFIKKFFGKNKKEK